MNLYLLICRYLHGLWRLYFMLLHSIKEEIFSNDYIFSLKRIVTIISLVSFFTVIIIWNYIGLFLDEILLYPMLKTFNYIKSNVTYIQTPTFIVGYARSGTTWLHRLLALDKETFTAMRTWEMVFAISLSWKLFFYLFYIIDEALFNSCLLALLLKVEYKIIYQNNDKSTYLHPVGLMEVEEDEWLMVYIGYSQLITLFFPLGLGYLGDVIAWHKGVNDQSVAMKKYVMSFYAYCIEKHILYKQLTSQHSNSNSNTVVYLSKNPAFTLRIPSLYEQFPDAKIVCLIRDPGESIPSMISYIAQVWQVFTSPRFTYPNATTLFDFCIEHYIYPLDQLNTNLHRENQFAFVYYHELKSDFITVIEGLFSRLYSEGPGQIGQTKCESTSSYTSTSLIRVLHELELKKKHTKWKPFVSKHQHSIQQCCKISNQEFREIMSVVYDAHKKLKQ